MSHTHLMRRNIRPGVRFAMLLLQAVSLSAIAQERPPQISEDEIKKHVSNPDCQGVDINSLEYFDFAGDGNEDAVVVASTCATGTAGPDVHAVLRRQPDGSLVELKVPEPTEKQYAALFGRLFYTLKVKDGLLLETYHDESGRTDPLVIRCRWNARDKEFQIVETKSPPRYTASFDCDKAKTPVENAICYSSEAASLDLALDRAYKIWLDSLNNADSDILMKEQKDWLHTRDVICDADRSAFQCVEILYRARLLEVEYFRHLHPVR
jgi:uncharacterized protein YecT (DUF1311 family)